MTCAVLTLPAFKPCGKPATMPVAPYPCESHAKTLQAQRWAR